MFGIEYTPYLYVGALPCSEIGLKWFLFALHDPGTIVGFVSVLDFFGDFVPSRKRDKRETGIRTIFDHFRNTQRANWTSSDSEYDSLMIRMFKPQVFKGLTYHLSESKTARSCIFARKRLLWLNPFNLQTESFQALF